MVFVRRPALRPALFLERELLARLLGRLLHGQGAPSARVVEAACDTWLGTPGREAALGRGLWASAGREGMRIEWRRRNAAADPGRKGLQ